MTDIIDLSITQKQYPNQLPCKQYGQIKGLICRGTNLYHSLKPKDQNHFSFMLKENKTQFDLLFDVSFNQPYTIAKIFLLSKYGDLLKFDSQFSRTYLIKKFFGIESLYQPHIDPLSGAIYFRIDYFEVKKNKQFSEFGEIDSILQNLNIQKLYRAIQKLSASNQIYEQHNWLGHNFGQQKYYKQLSKAVSLLNESQTVDAFLNSDSNSQKNPQDTKGQKKVISQFSYFLGGRKKNQNSFGQKKLRKHLKQLEQQNFNLNALLKRKSGKSNYQPLLINFNSQKLFKQAMVQMVQCNIANKSMKAVQSQMGKVTINLEKQDQKVFKMKTKLLNSLPKNTEYHFLDKYFKNDLSLPVLMSLSLKQESLPKYLECNKMTISFETKIRILLQICSAVHTFWEQKRIILFIYNLKKIFITKNLTVKIRSLNQYFKVQPHMIIEDKLMVNTKLNDNYLNLSQVYFKLLFNHNLIYIRPSKQRQTQKELTQFDKSLLIFQNLMGTKLLPEGFQEHLKQVLVGLNYLFLSFVEKARCIVNQKKNITEQIEVFQIQNEEEEYQKRQEEKKILNYKFTCCWLLKIFENLTQEQI